MNSQNLISYDSYQKMAGHYSSYVDDNQPYNSEYERPATLSLLDDVDGKNVLDAGCAAGFYTEWLINHGAQVTSADFSPNMLEMTKKRVGNKTRLLQCDFNKPLDLLESNSFDIIIASLVLHYIKDWSTVMSEFNRILKSNGYLVFSVHHPFMDFYEFEVDNYFHTELLEDEWIIMNNEKVKVEFYRRPLCDIVKYLNNSKFTLEKLLEPMPTEKFKKMNPAGYDRVSKNPHFVFIKARK